MAAITRVANLLNVSIYTIQQFSALIINLRILNKIYFCLFRLTLEVYAVNCLCDF